MPAYAPKDILCPIDLSAASAQVLRWARLFAEAYHAKVEILYADWQEWPPYFLASQAGEFAAQTQHHRETLRRDLDRLAQETLGSAAPYEIKVVEGHPVDAILKYATAARPGLIVMGSHGRSGLARLRLGSVAENVMRAAVSPTLVVRALGEKSAPAKISRILCPVNFSEPGRGCLEFAAEVAAKFEAEFVVMHAIEQSGADLEETRMRLCQWVPEAVRRNCRVTQAIRSGNPAEQILLAARDRGIDLIVLGAQHRALLEFTTLGTTTERVMRHSESAVLVVPSGERVVP